MVTDDMELADMMALVKEVLERLSETERELRRLRKEGSLAKPNRVTRGYWGECCVDRVAVEGFRAIAPVGRCVEEQSWFDEVIPSRTGPSMPTMIVWDSECPHVLFCSTASS